VADLEPLPFQEGKPLATTAEESTELVEVSSDELISRQVLIVEEGEDDGLSPNETLDMISEDESTANTGDDNDTEREARKARNRARAARRRRVNERIRSMHRELDAEFAVVRERGFRIPMANIARVTAILQRSNDPNLRKHFAMRREHGSSSIDKTWHQPSEKNTWAKAAARLTVERQAAVLNINEAITTIMLVEVRPLAGGRSHLQEATRDYLIIPTIGILKKTCTRKLMKDAMCDP
jgi:type I restriction-modification system DNA methylase subunit